MTHGYATHEADTATEGPVTAIGGDLLGPRALTSTHDAFEYIGTILESSAECSVIATDAAGVILLWNEGAHRLYGYEPSEIIGQSVTRLHTEEDVLAGLPESMMQAARTNGKWSGRVERARRNGSRFTARVVMIARGDSSGNELGFLLVSSDATGDADTEDLKRALTTARDASRLKSEFMANMSHEIRTPMYSTVVLTELLSGTVLDSEQRGYVDGLTASNHALQVVINDILDFAALEADALVLEPSDFDVRSVVREARAAFDPLAVAKGLTIEEAVENAVPLTVTGDQRRLRRVLSKLISNAVKFTGSGGIVIRVTGADDGLLRFAVSDDGIGVEEARSAALFDAFVQEDGSTTRQHGGTGIGLTIARELVELMGGEIGAMSRDEGGSTFWFTAKLPAALNASAKAPATPGRADWSAWTVGDVPALGEASPLVLIVEDNLMNQAVAKIILHKRGLRTELAKDGRQAVEMAAANRYAAIFMDCQMPTLDGYAATRLIREAESGRRTPIIAMTASAMPGDRERCLDSGMDDYVCKPVESKALDAAISQWLPAEGAARNL